ncbi:MAG: beta-galactosidase [Anaerolineae bacterium]|nr:beta-galactosidase [Anaerolineae bacterium]
MLAAAIVQLAPAAARVPVEPPPVVTHHPILCMHTRLDGEVTDVNMYRTLRLVREMGATSIVQLFLWAYLEPAEDVYDWQHADRIIDMADRQGLTLIARLGFVPAWARPDPDEQPTTLNYLTPDRYPDYAEFVADFAARYRGRVDMIVPWNEPNLAFEWGFRQTTPAEYVDMLRQVYTAAHAANPDVIILGGALAPTIEPEGSPAATDDIVYLRRMYEAGAADVMDALAVHTYGFTLPPDDPPAPDRLNFRRFEMLLGVMRDVGDAERPVYITESSWNDHPRWVHAVRPGQRIEYTLDALRYAERAWPTVRNLCFWYFRSPVLHRTYQDYFAFVTFEFRPRPIYDEVRAWALSPALGATP